MHSIAATKLAWRMGLGFAFLIALILIVGVIMTNNINTTYRGIATQISHFEQTNKAIYNIIIDIGTLRRFEKNYFLQLEDARLRAGNLQRWHLAFEHVQNNLTKLEGMLPKQEQTIVLTAKHSLTAYFDAFSSFQQVISAQGITSATQANQMFTTSKKYIRDFNNTINEIQDLSAHWESQQFHYLEQMRINRLWQLFFAIMLPLTVAAILFFYITRYSFQVSKGLELRAYQDPLTQLLNRNGFETEIQLLPSKQGALLYLDLDQFKLINDLCSHAVGDELLVQLSQRFSTLLPSTALIARLGGDEFGVMLPQYTLVAAQDEAQKLLHLIQTFPFSSKGQLFALNGSIGIALSDEQTLYQELIARADTACHVAKARGTGQITQAVDVENLHQQMQLQKNWAAKIPLMLHQNRFVLFYQRMENLQHPAASVGHVEILVRGLDEQGALVPPGLFLPAAERYQLISRIDRWVTQAVLKSALPANTIIAINLSGPSLGDSDFLQKLVEGIKTSHLLPTQLCFEITETAAMTDIEAAKLFISTLKALGCAFALDDFGSGFSSFSYLKDLDVDYLKIDGSLIRNLAREGSDRALVTAIVEMAKALQLSTIAEFVENAEQKEILRLLGVNYAQGYAIHKPEAIV